MQISRHFFSRTFSDESECCAAQSAQRRFHHLSNLRFTFRGSRAELIIALPRRIDRVLGEIEQGNLRVWTRVEDIEPLMKRLEHMVARSNATLLAAACIVGLAVVMQFYHPSRLQRWTDAVFWIAVAILIIDYVRTLLTLRRRK